jgi:hypothetical protein
MKTNHWKWVAVILAAVSLWLAISGHSVAAQYGQGTRITKLTGLDLMNGPVNVPGEVKGFSCVADVDGNLDKGNGDITSTDVCYVLSK